MRMTRHGRVATVSPLIGAILLLVAMIFLSARKSWWVHASLREISLALILVGLLTLIIMGAAFKEKAWSLPFLFLLILFLFHGGLFIYPAFYGVPSPYLEDVASAWFRPSLASRSAYLLVLAFLAYSLGSTLAFLSFRKKRIDSSRHEVSADHNRGNLTRSFAVVGSLTVILSVSFWLVASVRAAGPLFFLGSYRKFLDATGDVALSTAYLGIALGVGMMAQDLRSRASKAGVFFFLLFALLGLPIGLRGEVLIPLAAGIMVYARTHTPPKFRFFALGIMLMLILIAGVKQLRQSGLVGFSSSDTDVSPFAAVEEMGYSVRVLFTSVEWHEVWNEPFLSGGTYVTPVVRFFERLMGIRNIPAQEDFGLMNVEIAARVGQIGGSVIGEAHHNFGAAGVVGILFLVGFVLSKCQLKDISPMMAGVLGLVGVLALMHIRNSFTPIFSWTIAGLLLIAAAVLLEKLMWKRSIRERHEQLGRR